MIGSSSGNSRKVRTAVKQVTIYDIAKEAKVSVATVSRVLNNTAPVKDSTRTKIMTLIDKYQFQPNALARSLTRKETGTLGIMLPDITNPFYPEVIGGIHSQAHEMGYTFFLCDTHGDYDKESQYLNELREKQVDGILFFGGRINLNRCKPEMVEEVMEAASRVPIVLVNGNLPGNKLHRVFTDEAKGAEMAARHLIELGHRNIACIAGNSYMSTTEQKVRAFKKVMEEHGLAVSKEHVLYGDFSMSWGEKAMETLLDLPSRPSAVFCINDNTAVGAVKAAFKKGLKIPEDVSIVGFDDIQLASVMNPELTTVSQKTDLLGRTAVDVLHKLITKEKVKRLTVIEPELMVRGSSQTFQKEI